jgi:hypothetical protein
MIKREYMITASVIASVLVGSLFYYNNITQAQKLRLYKETVKINVLSPRSTEFYESYEVWGGVLANNVSFPFKFNPKHEFLNVTDVWILAIIGNLYGSSTLSQIKINDATVTVSIVSGPRPRAFALHITDINIYQTLTPGINTITLTFSGGMPEGAGAYEINILITYEYQAR